VGIGSFVATSLPLMPPSRVGPQFLATYLRPYAFVLAPNLVITTSAFFCLAALSRRMLPVYVGAVLVLLGYLIAVNLVGDVEHRTLAAFVDPFGIEALDDVTHYWSVAEKNSRPIPLTGHFLWNRVTDADGNALALERRRLRSGPARITLVVDKLPARAGIDPVDELIDRQPDDNLIAVTPGR
jgi:hypothetical protein